MLYREIYLCLVVNVVRTNSRLLKAEKCQRGRKYDFLESQMPELFLKLEELIKQSDDEDCLVMYFSQSFFPLHLSEPSLTQPDDFACPPKIMYQQCVGIYSYLGLSIPEKMKPVSRTHVTCDHRLINFDRNVSHTMLS